MDSALTDLSVGAILAVLVIREVLGFLKDRKNNKSGDLSLMARQLADLHQWHSLTDEEGVKVWYVRRSLEEAIRELSANISTQTEVLRNLVLESRETRKRVEERAARND